MVLVLCGPWEYNMGMYKSYPRILEFKFNYRHPSFTFSQPTFGEKCYEPTFESVWITNYLRHKDNI
jgi:hypothetical protein